MAKTKQNWVAGDIFEIELGDGTKLLGQVIQFEPDAMNSIICGYTLKEHGDGLDFEPSDFVSIQFTTRENIDHYHWKVIGNASIPDRKLWQHLTESRQSGFIGVKILGAGNILKFLEACSGLRAWDSFFDPEYFDKLLLPGVVRPPKAFFEK
jgi:hypothetical protein